MSLIVPHLTELVAAFEGLELKFRRGTADEVGEGLKKGDAELAIAGPLGTSWDRFDAWPLFTEECGLLVPASHALASRNAVTLQQLTGERLLRRAFCEQADKLDVLLREKGVACTVEHAVASEADLATLLGANVGIAIAPRSTATTMASGARYVAITDLEIQRTVYAYAVAGRARSPAGNALLKLLRAFDWRGQAG